MFKILHNSVTEYSAILFLAINTVFYIHFSNNIIALKACHFLLILISAIFLIHIWAKQELSDASSQPIKQSVMATSTPLTLDLFAKHFELLFSVKR
mgnify:CR=1 FL=1